jgi:hypothetical protein
MEPFLPYLVVLVGVPILIGYVLVLSNLRLPFTMGWVLARWASAEAWRPKFVAVLMVLVALAVAVWAARLQMPILVVIFVVMVGSFAGAAGFRFDRIVGAGRQPAGHERDPLGPPRS